MRRAVAVFVFFTLVATAHAQPREVRGVWITNVDSQVMFSKGALAEAMDYLASRGFNVIYPVVWNKGYTLFPSDVMNEHFGQPLDPALGGRDALAEIIVEAHRNGLEVIPWFEFGFASSYEANGGHLLQAKPHWAALDNQGNLLKKNGFEWMNGLHQEVQDFMLALVREVIEKYDVDGIQGDDRLPAMPSEGGYSQYTRELYAAEHDGATVPTNPRETAFLQWKADKLTAFAGRLYRMVKVHDESLLVTFSPSIYPWSLHEYLQDWPTWLDSAYVDLVHPQAYRWDIDAYKSTVRAMVGTAPGVHNGYVAAEHLDRITPGLIVKAGSQFNGWPYVKEAVAFNRDFGIEGEVYFFYEGLREKNDFLADSLHRYFYQEPSLLPMRSDIRRAPPAIAHEEDAVRTGTWSESTISGFDGNMLRTDESSGASITWTLTAPSSGLFDVYAYQPQHRRDATRSASFTATAGTTSSRAAFDQWSTSVQGWLPVGRFDLAADEDVAVTLVASADGAVYADAVMLLKNLNPTSILQVPTSSEAVPEVPGRQKGLLLHPPYPLPARDTTQLSFTLSRAARVHLQIFDTLGRQVVTLYDGVPLPAGLYQVTADITSLAAGVYVCSVRTDEAHASASIIVVR